MENDPVRAFVVSEEGNGRVLTPVRDESTKNILDMKNHDKSKGGKKKGNGGNYGRARPPPRGANQSRTFPSTSYNSGGPYQPRVNTFSTPKPPPPKPSYPTQSKPTYGDNWGDTKTLGKSDKGIRYYSKPSTGYVTGGNENKIFDPTAGKRKPNTTVTSPSKNVVSTNGNLDSRMKSTSNFEHTKQHITNGHTDSYSPAQNHSSSRPPTQNYASAYNPISASHQSPGKVKSSASFSKPIVNTQSRSSDSIKSMELKMDRMNINLETPAQIIFNKASDEVKHQLMFKHTRQYPNIGLIPLLEYFQDGMLSSYFFIHII